MLLTTLNNMFPQDEITHIEHHLSQSEEEKFQQIKRIRFLDPLNLFISSIFLGIFGIDRFLLGDKLLGLFKLLTLGGMGIWLIIDCCTVINRTKSVNSKMLFDVLRNK